MENNKKTEVAKAMETKSVSNILELKNITKTFLGGKVIANDNVSITFKRNEIHSLVGENGSGKSTLMNIIFGLYKQDKGNVFINNKKVDMYAPGAAKKNKIGMVHQHFHLVDNFTVIENVVLGQEKISVSSQDKEKNIKELKEIRIEIKSIIKLNKLDEFYSDLELTLESIKEHKYNARKLKNIRKELAKEMKKLSPGKHQRKIDSKNLELDRLTIEMNEEKSLLNSFKFVIDLIRGKKEKRLLELVLRRNELEDLIHNSKLTGAFGKLNKKEILKRFIKIQNKYNINLDPYAKVSTLSVGQRQMVEILKVLWEEKDLIVFDEPTATLSVVEIKELLTTIKELKAEGKTIIFISHKLKEIKEISDRISVLRKGVLMGTHKNTDKLKPADIGKEMVGREVKLTYPKRKITGKDILEIKNLSYRTRTGFKALDSVSFSVKEGEIFGLAGIEGNGQEEIVKLITNLRKPQRGEIKFKGKVLTDSKGYKLSGLKRRKIMSHAPIDRIKHGIVPPANLLFNAKISDFDTGKFKKEKLSDFTNDIVEKLNVDGAFNNNVEIRSLSGGNQQKFVVGREILRDHEIFIAGHPTRGLDISAIDLIYKKMLENSKGKATILYSLEISELVAVCDRMAIMYKGKIVDIINPKEISMDEISKMMIGVVK